jgi:hypothetical protein
MIQNRKTLLFTIALMSTGLSLPVTSFAGGASSGGGTSVQPAPHAQPVLLDYYLHNPRFADIASKSNDLIAVSEFAKTIGYDRLSITIRPSYGLALARLQAWEKNSPVVVNLIRVAMRAMEWTYTPFNQRLCGEAKTANDQLNLGLPMESAVVFRKDVGASISAQVWNGMGGYSHGGLVVHEALRHVQFMIGESMDYTVLMNVTAKIMLENPEQQVPGYTLDNARWFGGEIKREIENAAIVKKGITESCQKISEEAARLPVLSSSLNALRQEFCQNYAARALDFDDSITLGGENRINTLLGADEKVLSLSNALASASHTAFVARQIELGQYNEVAQITNELAQVSTVRNDLASSHALFDAEGAVSNIDRATLVLTGGFSEGTLRKYLSGDHSEFGIFSRPKINRAIEQAQSNLSRLMLNGYTLRCE